MLAGATQRCTKGSTGRDTLQFWAITPVSLLVSLSLSTQIQFSGKTWWVGPSCPREGSDLQGLAELHQPKPDTARVTTGRLASLGLRLPTATPPQPPENDRHGADRRRAARAGATPPRAWTSRVRGGETAAGGGVARQARARRLRCQDEVPEKEELLFYCIRTIDGGSLGQLQDGGAHSGFKHLA